MTPQSSIVARLMEVAATLDHHGYFVEADAAHALRSLAGEIEEVESEKLELIGYISTLGPHINQHPEHVLQWWNERRASRLAAPEEKP